ncbi:MAG: amino acid permease [Bacteroidota bacterium]|nr:amino acid permease [Candidatus Kapabacteria bacterium]MCX7936726.1 amino acid permease [Chlorobiota bacterium]MDW8074230.1 amino acid permease [Bacteroidota bacterium]MDW8271294.1 amino acid permease [Bacteroidota bacterium]
MPSHLFIKKSIAQLQNEAAGVGEAYTLKRTLGALNLVLLGIGAIIGAGLFSLTGIAAAHHAGPAVTLSYVLAGVGCAFAALCYAEFASMIPIAGSAYTYAYATMGELIAWIIGWDLVLEYAVGAATVAVSWSRYFSKLLESFGIKLPAVLMMSPFEHQNLADGSIVSGVINLPAVLIIVLISLLLMRGTRESALANAIIVALKVGVVITFIVLGWQYIDPGNYVPYVPPNTGVFGQFGWSGVLTGAAIVFFAFIGFDAVSTAAQEARNPQKDMPIGIIGSLAICTVLYVLFAHVMTGLENYKNFAGEAAPVARAIAKTPYLWLQQAIIIAILAGFTSVILVMLLGQSRVFYSISKDGLLPKIFSDIHPRFRTPWKSNALFAVFVGSLAGFLPITVVGEMTSIGTLFAFILVSLGVLILRYTQPEAPRAFRTPGVPVVPILGVVTCAVMMYSLPWDTWLRLVVWMAIGLLIYFTYGVKRSILRKTAIAQG